MELRSRLMTQKILLACLVAMLSTGAYAQDAYRLLIQQVFPKNKEVYYNAFDYRRELENATAAQTARLKGNDCNYKLQITTPSGISTRYIQNINWIQTVNGTKTYHKSKTQPQTEYPVATIWSGSECTPSGSPTGKAAVYEYVYRVAEGKSREYKSAFLTKADAEGYGKKLFNSYDTDTVLIEVNVLRITENSIDIHKTFTNKEKYTLHLQAKEEERRKQELAKSIAEFLMEMEALEKHGTNDTRSNIDKYLNALEKTLTSIPEDKDSIFYKEHLDSVYQKVFRDNYLKYFKKREIKEFQKSYDYFHLERTQRDSLIEHTKRIKSILPQLDN